MLKTVSCALALLALVTSFEINAHSEHDKARFVSPNGKDVGNCDNALRPCKSIGYAVSKANKGDSILLSAGIYDINSTEELFYLKSSLVPVFGGYNRFDHFQSQSPQSNVTTLTNIPSDMVKSLRENGFNVLSDGKSFQNNTALKEKLASYHQLSQSQFNTTCTDGKADIFECNNIDLLAHIPLTEMSGNPDSGSDIWGHVDLNTHKEYAIMTLNNGIVVVDVSDPTSPKEVGTIDGVNSSWRDVKVYQFFDTSLNLWQAYAYVTTEGSRTGATDYVTIIDLNNLPNSVNVIENNRVVTTAHNIYISNVDYTFNTALPNQKASLQLVGANSKNGAFQNYSLEDPKTLVNGSSGSYGSGYTHDGASLSIDDQRAVNDCGISSGNCTLFIDFNEKEMKLWNITDPENTAQLGSVEYDDVIKDHQYVHSGWGTEDHQFVLLHDEFDEYRGGLNTTIRIFSIQDLNNPVQVGQWTGPTRAIDHNGFVRGNRYYMSNYERGLTILDITDPTQPNEVGFFDTYTLSNSSGFNGAWGVYPFLPSGNILVSDINSGLYILKDNTRNANQGSISFVSKTIESEQNTNLEVIVTRDDITDLSQSVSVEYTILPGSAQPGEDYQATNGTLTWAANDTTNKSININIASDSTGNEFKEEFFIRLYNPSNGSVLGENSYVTVNLDGKEDAGAASFELDQLLAAEDGTPLAIGVNRIGSTSGTLTVDYLLTGGEAEVGNDVDAAQGQLQWQDGENDTQYIEVSLINDDIEEQDESFTIALTAQEGARLGTNGTIEITIADDDANTAPSVSVSENFQVNTSQNVNLTATASDAENDELTYLWQQTSGTEVTINNADTLNASFTAPNTAGSLTFEITVTDFRGATSNGSVTVSVIAPSVVPKSSGGGGGHALWLLILLLPCWLARKKLQA